MVFSSPASTSRNSPRVWALLGGLVVLAFFLWPSSTASLPNLAELSPSFANHFSSSGAAVPSPLRVDASAGPVPVADAALPSDKDNWWQDISVVYTWVNGSEATFLEEKAAITGEGVENNRFRDDGLFRYSVRSIQRFMPWHKGEIILLSRRSHLPAWIDAEHPRFRHVAIEDIMPSEAFPTFDSNAIEAYMHLIPGLTNRFLYFNDDFFLARPTSPELFFTPTGGVKLFREWDDVRDRVGDDDWTVSVKTTGSMIEAEYGKLPEASLRVPAHAPYAFLRNALRNLHAHERFGPALRESVSHRVRWSGDVNVHILHAAYAMFDKAVPSDLAAEVDDEHRPQFVAWTDDAEANELSWQEMLEADPPFFNVNDEMDVNADSALEALWARMEAMYPQPSFMEKSRPRAAPFGKEDPRMNRIARRL
ncbi:uncharacterized protein JCM15063_000317 [Sporobolomyces koalae]|uniref:uncharacterized protein n=1 Tax=Sporobolomyces koalae TaxID=500713 RepID=UPI0031803E6F